MTNEERLAMITKLLEAPKSRKSAHIAPSVVDKTKVGVYWSRSPQKASVSILDGKLGIFMKKRPKSHFLTDLVNGEDYQELIDKRITAIYLQVFGLKASMPSVGNTKNQ